MLYAGKMHVTVDDRPHTAATGDILLYRAGAPHEEATDRRDVMDMRFVAFHGGIEGHAPICLHDTHGRVRLLAEWLEAEWRSARPRAQAAAEAFLEALVKPADVRLRDRVLVERWPLARDARVFLRAKLFEQLARERVPRLATRRLLRQVLDARRITGVAI